LVPLAEGKTLEIDGGIVGRVIDEDIDAAQFTSGFFHRGFHAGFIGHVAAKSEGADAKAGEVDDGVLSFASGVQKRNRNIGARPGQGQSGRPAESLGAAGDEAGFAPQKIAFGIEHFGILLPRLPDR
jgi:hypothetical protein